MVDCDHEEADSRIVVHILHTLEQNANTVQVRTVDTDVLVILIGKFHDIKKVYPHVSIWVAFGMGKHFRFYSVNTICASLGEFKSRSVPVFHAFSGCDSTSSFTGKGKVLAWKAWKAYEQVTEAFEYLSRHPFKQLQLSSDVFKSIERYTVVLYDKHSQQSSINEARMEIFCEKSPTMDKLPPLG